MATRRTRADDLARLERKLDRLTRLVIALLVLQPILLFGALLPDATTQPVMLGLMTALAVLAAFPNMERKLPKAARRLGRLFGRLRQSTRFSPPRAT